MSQILANDVALEKPLLQVRNLSVTFKSERGTLLTKDTFVKAVNNVSLDLYEGEICSLVGESGSGKTTVAMCISRLVTPTSGSIQFNGKEITRLTGREQREYLRDVQIIYQDPYESLNPRMNVYTQISTPIRYLVGEKKKSALEDKVSRLLEEVHLSPDLVIHKLPHQLSGGERQRVNIARALASDPKLLIADEPISMLDASLRLRMLKILYELKKKRNLTVLLITHDLASAKLVSKRIMVMYLGRIFEVGATKTVLSDPYHPYVQLIKQATPSLDKVYVDDEEQAKGSIDNAGFENGCMFRTRCKYATEKCGAEVPRLDELSSKRWVACFNPLGHQGA